MDLLFKEYASPFSLLDEVIRCKRFHDFLITFDEQVNERMLWDFYLHRIPVWEDVSFDDFKKRIKRPAEQQVSVSDDQLETIATNSIEILSGFIPE